MRTRDWPIRSKLTALVVAPVTALLALWIFATTLTFGPALDLLSARTLLYDLGRPGESVVTELQRERRLSLVQLGGAAELPALIEQRQRTDRAVAELRRRVDGEALRDAADDLLDARVDQLVTALAALPTGRGFIDDRKVDRAGALGLYSGMISAAFQAFEGMATLSEPDLNREALALTALGRSRELLGQADALLAGALTAGRFAEGEHAQFVQAIGNQRWLTESAVADLPDADRAAYQRLSEGEAFTRLRTMQDALVAANRSGRPPVNAATWQANHDAVQQQLRDFELAQADGLTDRSVPMAVGILVRLAAAGVLGLVAVVISVLVALRVGRTLVRRLSGVRTVALELAEHRLPDVVTRLRRGEQVDVAREVPRWSTATTRSARSGAPSPRCSARRSRPRWTRSRCAGASTRSSSTSPGAARAWCTGNWPCWTGWNGGPRTRTNWPSCSRWTTSPPGSAGTPRTWSFSPAPRRAGVGATRSRWSTWSGARSPRSRRTTGWTSPPSSRPVCSAGPSATSSTCSPS
ncbi:hypothetical protein GCM10027614_34380 [Micromonospora vulcania]